MMCGNKEGPQWWRSCFIASRRRTLWMVLTQCSRNLGLMIGTSCRSQDELSKRARESVAKELEGLSIYPIWRSIESSLLSPLIKARRLLEYHGPSQAQEYLCWSTGPSAMVLVWRICRKTRDIVDRWHPKLWAVYAYGCSKVWYQF